MSTNIASTLDTPHGTINILDTGLRNDVPTLLLLHGNSSSSKIFKHIFSQHLTSKRRVIAFDYPGHGSSSDAKDPNTSYSMRGYADLAIHILEHLQVASVVVFGWSLGGHVAIEMIPLLSTPSSSIQLKGIMIVGTPPANGLAQTDKGFTFTDGHMSLAAKQNFTPSDINAFSHSTAGGPFEQWMEEDVRRCDGNSRHLMWKSFAEGTGVDQRGVLETEENVLVGVVNGANEPFVNLDYIDGLKIRRLWKEKCLRLEGQGHAPFWEKPEEFEPLLLEFLEDCSKT